MVGLGCWDLVVGAYKDKRVTRWSDDDNESAMAITAITTSVLFSTWFLIHAYFKNYIKEEV